MNQLSDNKIYQIIAQIIQEFDLLECYECAKANRKMKIKGLREILHKIQDKPGLYLGKPSINDLFMFVVGYEFARGELGIQSTEWEDDFHRNFQSWLQQKYQINTANSWAKIILFYSFNEKDGFEKFFKLLNEFQKRDQDIESQQSSSLSATQSLLIT